MAYSDFLQNINQKFQSLFSEISAEYNFDYGHEFEIALCKVLRIILPNKYGICRGFVVSKDGQIAGDDIIIYDQERFPTLRLLQDPTFAQKQKVPVEAVYAYIEAKHTLCLEGTGGQSLAKSLSQIQNVKAIPREQVALNQITHQVKISNYNPASRPYWPKYRNPIFTAVISKQVRISEAGSVLDADQFYKNLRDHCNILARTSSTTDLIIAGQDVIALPGINKIYESPFFINGISDLYAVHKKEMAFGTGLTSMLYALDSIQLGNINWPTVVAEGLDLKLNLDMP